MKKLLPFFIATLMLFSVCSISTAMDYSESSIDSAIDSTYEVNDDILDRVSDLIIFSTETGDLQVDSESCLSRSKTAQAVASDAGLSGSTANLTQTRNALVNQYSGVSATAYTSAPSTTTITSSISSNRPIIAMFTNYSISHMVVFRAYNSGTSHFSLGLWIRMSAM